MCLLPIIFAISFFWTLVAANASAQDVLTSNPKMVTVLYEDARVRVLRVRCGPHEKMAMHSHPAAGGVRLTRNDSRVTFVDGRSVERHTQPGETYWSEPAQHAVENLSDQPFENIEIEFKQANQPAVTVEPGQQHAASGSEPVPVELEPHHHNVYQNQYVRMLDVQLEPGDTALFHTHSHDNVAVRLNDAMSQNQNWGKDWDQPSKVEAGAVTFMAGTKKPYTHRIKNTGTTLFHVIDIELLQPPTE